MFLFRVVVLWFGYGLEAEIGSRVFMPGRARAPFLSTIQFRICVTYTTIQLVFLSSWVPKRAYYFHSLREKYDIEQIYPKVFELYYVTLFQIYSNTH
jgi:hypothetical protein